MRTSSRIDKRPGLLHVARHHHRMGAVGDELDDDLRVLRLAAELLGRCAARSGSGRGRRPARCRHTGTLIVPSSVTRWMPRSAPGRWMVGKMLPLVALEDAHLQQVARRHGDARAGRQIAGRLDGRSRLAGGGRRRRVVGVRSMTSNGRASVLVAWAPPIHGPSPGRRCAAARAPRARPRTTATGRATGHSQLQIVKSRSPSRSGRQSRAAPPPVP